MRVAIIAAILALGIPAQSPPRFEAASVKLADYHPETRPPGERGSGGGCPTSMRIDPARFEVHCATLAMLIGYAYRHPPDRIKGPDWMMAVGSPRFEIAAALGAGASKVQVPEMLKALLTERFHLALHRRTIAGPGYALVAYRNGPNLKGATTVTGEAEEADSIGFYGTVQDRSVNSGTIITSPHIGTVKQTDSADHRHQRWDSDGISMEGLAELLDKVAPLSVPIVDMTGIKGRYRMSLEVALNDLGGPAELEARVVKAFNDGLQKLGLQLQQRKGEVVTLVIDHVERTPTGN
jgi:uncharacterized protein (TIGR03435 family)